MGNRNKQKQVAKYKESALKIGLFSIWVLLLIVCISNRDIITIENIVNRAPSNTALAILAIMILFALKSVSFVIYCGILYAASGILFPMYLAIPVSVIGTVIMVTIPFFLGRQYGNEVVYALVDKYPKLRAIHRLRSQNDFLFSFLIRFVGQLPSDPVSMYMGATGTKYLPYLLGSLLELLPGAVAITIMGTSITDIKSPQFIFALLAQILIGIISIITFVRYAKRNNI